MLDEKMQEYRDSFGDIFPLMLCMDMTDDEIIVLIQSCLDSGKPYEPQPEAVY